MKLIFSLDGSVPLLHFSLAFSAGTLLDPPGKEGTTRLLLRLLRRSAKGRTALECDEQLDRMGASLSGEANRTVAAIHGATLSRSSAQFLAFVEDCLTAPSFDEAEFKRAVAETEAELVESLDSDSGLVRRFWARRYFQGHPYARSSVGTPESLKAIALADIKAMYERLLSSGELSLAFSGLGDEAQLRAWAEKLEQRLAQPSSLSQSEGSSALKEPTGVNGRHLLFVDKPLRAQTQILMGCQGTLASDDDHTALYLGNTIFGGTFSARLSQEVRAKRGWSYGAYSNLPFDKQRQPFTLWTFPKAEDAADCIRLKLSMLSELVSKGVTKKELAAAKKYLLRSHVFSIDTPAKRAGQQLDALTYELPQGYHADYEQRVAACTLEEVNAALAHRLSADNLLVCVVGTASAIGDQVAAAIDGLSSQQTVPFNGKLSG